MNKTELIANMAEKSGLTKVDAEKALSAFLKTTEEVLSNGDKLQLVGFGTFEITERAARQGRNPRNPEQIIEIPASKSAKFKAGKDLKDKINNK